MTSRRVRSVVYSTLLLFFLIARAGIAWSQSVTTYHYDNYRTGWNSNETVLTPANVNSSSFGLLYSVVLDDQVDSQPLYMQAVNITAGQYQGMHNVVYVATEGNTIYAIDAETGTVLLSSNFGTPIPRPLGCNNNGPNVGINSTPVIDPATSTLYAMVYTSQSSTPVYLLHALDLGSLADKVPPQVVTASHTLTDGSTFNFTAKYQRQRAGLLLANGNIYAGFGSFCDIRPDVSRGWLLGWQAGTLQALAANDLFDIQATSPRSFFLSSIWMSGFGPSTDDLGNVLAVTGNSDKSGMTYDGVTNIQESVIKISPDLSRVVDLFTPSAWSEWDKADGDFGSGGVMVLPDQPGLYPHLAVAAGKRGGMFFLNEDSLGGYSSTNSNVLGNYSIGGCWCGPSYFVDPVDAMPRIVSSGGTQVKVWRLDSTPTPSLSLVANSASLGGSLQDAGFFTSVSSNNTSDAIIWAVTRPQSSTNPVITLYAFDPDLGKNMVPLFQSQAGTWPSLTGNANIVPVVADGKVLVASYGQLQIFGLSATVTTALSSSPNPSSLGQSVTLSATVTTHGGQMPTGTVTFLDGTAAIGSSNLAGGIATLTTSTLSLGTHSITASYSGDSTFSPSRSSPLIQTTNQDASTTAVSSSVNPSAYAQPITLSATVSPSYLVPATGTVTFFDGGTSLGTVNLSNNAATLSGVVMLPGSHTVTAGYSGDVNVLASTSAALIQTVSQEGTTTSLVASPTPAAPNQPVTYTATVRGQYGGATTGTVTFKDGSHSTTVPVAGGGAVLTKSYPTTGSRLVTATYSGDTSNSGSAATVKEYIKILPVNSKTVLATSSSPSVAGGPVTFTATVTSSFGQIPDGETVSFYDGVTLAGTGATMGGVATFTTSSLTAKAHSIKGTYAGDSVFRTSSGTVKQVVNP